MKRCPYCGKIYKSDIIEVCPLMHCPLCGSASLYKKEYVDSNDKFIELEKFDDPTLGNLFCRIWLILGIAIILCGIIILFIYTSSPEIAGWVIFVGGVWLFFSFIWFGVLYTPIYCRDCDKKFYIPKKNIPLESIESTIKKCPKCRTILPKEAKFCGKCGTKLD